MSEAPAKNDASWYSWGSSMVQYATDSLNSFLGWEDFEVVNPEGDKVLKGDQAAMVNEGVDPALRKQVWGTKQFQKYIGTDVTSLLSVPVWIMEPFTILQKALEAMEYTDLLDKADQCDDRVQRFAWVAAYCVSPFNCCERAWKPFNPILGETYELEVGNGVRCIAEQVSHHPPVCAAHAENQHFTYDLISAPTTKFLGNYLDVFPLGRTRLKLKRSGEVFTLVPPSARVHNIVIGRTWVDAFGPLTVTCPTGELQCVLNFTPCGWFSYGRYEFSGYISDKTGKKYMRLSGHWNAYCDMEECAPDGTVHSGTARQRLWTSAEKRVGDYYGFTNFAHLMNSSQGIKTPLPSDSRRRPDRAALAEGEMALAGSEKYRLEEQQRAERREREARKEEWVPRWFRLMENPVLLPGELDAETVPHWEFTGEYYKLPAGPVVADGNAVNGKGFSPWQYPEIAADKPDQ